MKEPLRWLDESSGSPEGALLRAAVNEPLPHRALLRAGQRVGASAALLSASAKALAGQSLAASTGTQTAAAVLQAAATSATAGTTLLFTLGKALTVGLGLGGLLVGTAHWTSQGRSTATTPTAQSVAVTERDRTAQSVGMASKRSLVEGEPSLPEPKTDPMLQAKTPVDDPSPSHRSPSSQSRLGTNLAPNAMSAPSEGTRERRGSNELAVAAPPGLREPQTRVASTALARFADEQEAPVAVKAKAAPSSEPLAPAPPTALRSTLAQEVRALDSVREALRAGEARRALDELNRADRERVFHRLSREAAVLRVEALGTLGRLEQAASLARQLIAEGVSPAQRQSLEHWINDARK